MPAKLEPLESTLSVQDVVVMIDELDADEDELRNNNDAFRLFISDMHEKRTNIPDSLYRQCLVQTFITIRTLIGETNIDAMKELYEDMAPIVTVLNKIVSISTYLFFIDNSKNIAMGLYDKLAKKYRNKYSQVEYTEYIDIFINNVSQMWGYIDQLLVRDDPEKIMEGICRAAMSLHIKWAQIGHTRKSTSYLRGS